MKQDDYAIRVARTVEEVEALRPHWELMQKHPNADIDFFLTVIGVRPGVIAPQVLALYKGGQLIAILAGRLSDERLSIGIGYGTLYRPRVRCLTIVYGGALGDCSEGNSGRFMAYVREQLRHREFDVALFEFLRMDSPLYRQAQQVGRFWQRDHCPTPNAHWRITQLGSYDEFVRGRSKNTRRNLKKWPKRLEKEFGGGRLRVQWRTRSEELPSLLTEMESIARQTYQRGLGAGFRSGEESRCLLRLAAERGWLRACVLYAGEKPIAFWDGFQYGTTYFGQTNGYLPAYREYRPGHYVLLKIIQRLCEEPDAQVMDLGFGDAEYKRELCDDRVDEASVHFFAPTLKGARINFIRTAILYANQFARWLLSKTPWASKVKKTWRQRLSSKDSEQVPPTDA